MKTAVLLRHADVDATPGPAPNNWPLNDAGRERAQALAHALGDAGVVRIYVSPAARTQQTAAPLAALLQLQPVVVPETLGQFVQQVLAAPSDAVVVVIGHSNTVPDMIVALGAAFPWPPIQEHEHDDLYIVTLPGGAAGALRLKYGAPMP
jgi:broad specificity phosphatase PhoE